MVAGSRESTVENAWDLFDQINALSAGQIAAARQAPLAAHDPAMQPLFSRCPAGGWLHTRSGRSVLSWDPITRARLLAGHAHHGQTDKLGVPYIHHPQGVVECLQILPQFRELSASQQEDAVVAGWLHDVLEDSDFGAEDLRRWGFSDGAVEAVEALTAREGEPREEYYERVAQAGPVAVAVKLADLTHNTLPARRAELPGSPSNPVEKPSDDAYSRLGRKYANAFQVFGAQPPKHLRRFLA